MGRSAVQRALVCILLPKQLGVRSYTHKDHRATFACTVIDTVNQQKITANMAFAVAVPISLECVITPFGAKGSICCDQV